jgi:hypothetical protein
MKQKSQKALARDAQAYAPEHTPLVTLRPSSERPVHVRTRDARAGRWAEGGLAGAPAYARTRGDL